MTRYLLLSYKVPRTPSAKRVSVWRKLRRLGAIQIQDSAWVLPAQERTLEAFQWLGAEIKELGGEYSLWEAEMLADGQSESLPRRFSAQVDESYQEILKALVLPEANRSALARRWQDLQSRDFFRSELGGQVQRALLNGKTKGD